MIAQILPLLIATAGIGANARALPQGVTELITPGASPESCSASSSSIYSLSIAPIAVAAPLRKRQDVTQIADGQIQAPANAASFGSPIGATSAAFNEAYAAAAAGAGAQGFSTSGSSAITQISDGQVQAPGSVPAPQAPETVQAELEAFSRSQQPQASNTMSQMQVGQIQAPQGSAAYTQFGQQGVPNAVTQIGDGQIQAPGAPSAEQLSNTPNTFTSNNPGQAALNQIEDGQIQVPHGSAQFEQQDTPNAVTQIEDGQVQAPQDSAANIQFEQQSANAIAQIQDGQVQAQDCAASSQFEQQIASNAANQIADGQVQVSQGGATSTQFEQQGAPNTVTQIEDGQVQAPQGNAFNVQLEQQGAFPSQAGQEFVETIAYGQVLQSPAGLGASFASTAGNEVTQIADGQVQAGNLKRNILQVRQNGVPVAVTLDNGVLTDSLGRRGYIADNRQLQFDNPPQGGAIYTAGFSTCGDGTLALGDSNTFYACGSSDFNNLYDQSIYPDNCNPVHIVLNAN